jgi:hypothetical protein
MADKRISQLVDRGTIANNDVVPIVVSGAVTTNKATISSIQTFMQGNLDLGVTSVGLSMPSAFVVSNSPVTASGNISVTGAGTVSQYIRGDGSLADFPQGGGGGGSSVNYYLNGSVSQGTIGGIAYTELSKVPILGTGTDFTINADGYIASFITDAGDPSLLQIPGGNWNFETYFQASSGGGTPTFYVELYKVDSGGTATLIASSSGSPELIAFGTNITPYFSSLAVPTTTLALTDRLAIRYYVAHSGRTITLHTENNTLCQIITTFTTGLTALNGLTAQVQNFATGTSGSDFNISSASTTHTFNLPTATSTIRGALSSTDWSTFNGKQAALNGTGFVKISGTTISYDNSTYLTTGTAASTYLPLAGGTLTGGLNGTSANFSGSVGIGTNTPEGSGLTVASGGILVSLDPGANRKVLELYATSTGAKVSSSYVGASSYGNLELLTSGLARLTLASTGAATFSSSVGIGTSPSALLHLRNGNTEDVSGSIIRMDLSGINPYWEIQARNGVNGANRKLGFFTSVTSSDVMTLTQAGNVGIGTTSPASFSRLEVAGTAGAQTDAAQQVVISAPTTTVGSGAGLRFNAASGAKEAVGIVGMVNEASGNLGAMTFHTYGGGANIPERMRITSGGYLKATSDGTYVASGSNFHELTATANGTDLLLLRHKGTDPYGLEIQFTGATPNNGTNWFQYFQDASAARFIVRSNGGLQNYQANDGNLSDERTKKDIEPLESYWDKFKAIEIVKFKYKDQTHDDFNIGVIAQQVEAVAPEFVDVDGWGKPELDEEGNEIVSEEEPLKSIYTADLYHATIKVLQEAMAKIEKLEAEIDSLKNQIK